MDAVSDCITELAFHHQRLPPVLNIVHPRPTSWNTIFKLLNDTLVLQKKLDELLPFIPFPEWLSLVESHAQSPDQALKFKIVCPFSPFSAFLYDSHWFVQPALKLLSLFRKFSAGDLQLTKEGRLDAEVGGLPTCSISKTQDISKTMRDLKPLGSEDVEKWVEYWDAMGLFE